MFSKCESIKRKLLILERKLEDYAVFCLDKTNQKLINSLHETLNEIIVSVNQMEEKETKCGQ